MRNPDYDPALVTQGDLAEVRGLTRNNSWVITLQLWSSRSRDDRARTSSALKRGRRVSFRTKPQQVVDVVLAELADSPAAHDTASRSSNEILQVSHSSERGP